MKAYSLMPITLTLTSCKRPELFVRTVESLSERCLDRHRLTQVIWVDDDTDESQLIVMEDALKKSFPWAEHTHIFKAGGQKGLGQSLNLILDNLKTDLVYHVEDDWEFIASDHFLTEATEIMEWQPHIKSVLTRKLDVYTPMTTWDGSPYFECERGIDRTGHRRGHGYSLNPSVQDLKFITRRFGRFKSEDVENSFGDAYYDDGYRVATLNTDYVSHIGTECSSFQLNQTQR